MRISVFAEFYPFQQDVSYYEQLYFSSANIVLLYSDGGNLDKQDPVHKLMSWLYTRYSQE